jgi:transcriptional regulator, araC family
VKKLKGTEVFDGIPHAFPETFEGMRFYLQRSRRSFATHSLFYENSGKHLLYTSLTTEVHLLPHACFRRINTPFLSVEYVREGTLFVRQRGEAYSLEAGELFLMQPGMEGEFLVGASSFCKKESFSIFGSLLPALLEKSGLAKLNVIFGINHSPVHRIFGHLNALEGCDSPEALLENTRLTFELLTYLAAPMQAEQAPRTLLELKSHLEESLDKEHTVQEMAQLYGCTPTHLTRLFRRHFHTTPYRLLIECRMRAAAKLLRREPELPIKALIERIGYRDALNFSTEFKKHFGVSPREYRRYLHNINGF